MIKSYISIRKYLNILLSILLNCILLRKSAAAILQRGEDCGANVDIVGEDVVGPAEPPCQQLARLDGHRGQLGLVVQHISDGINRVHICPLCLVMQDLAILGVQSYSNLYKKIFKVKLEGAKLWTWSRPMFWVHASLPMAKMTVLNSSE